MINIFLQAKLYPVEFLTCIIMAAIPALVWLRIFLKKHPERKGIVGKTFVFGMLSAAAVLAYQSLWGETGNFVYFKVEAVDFQSNIKGMVEHSLLASLFIFMSVGVMEEITKHYAVVKADRKIFESVDDVIELSIVSALGFAFLENIGYFFMLMINGQSDQVFSVFLLRSTFVVFIHILCSGIYGAYYGMGHFAKPYMAEQIAEGKKFILAKFFHKIFHLREATVFREKMMIEGLLIACILHGIYDFILDSGLTIAGKDLYIFALPLYLVGGYLYLSSLIAKKENHEVFGHLVTQEEYEFDEQPKTKNAFSKA